MSLTLFAVVAATAALGGYLAGRAARRRAPEPAPPADEAPWGEGDVLCFPGGTDVVLADERRMLRDGVEVVRTYTCGDGQFVALWPPPDAHVLLLRPVSVDVARPPPTRLEIGDRTLVRAAMLTLDAGQDARVAEYRDGDAAALVLTSRDDARAWLGARHRAADVDRLAGETR